MTTPDHDPTKTGSTDAFRGAHYLTNQLGHAEAEPQLPAIDAPGLERDFQQTFLLANNDGLAQEIIMSALANSYVKSTDPNNLNQAMGYIASRLDKYRAPRKHIHIDPADYENVVGERPDGSEVVGSFHARWEYFADQISQAQASPDRPIDTLQCLGGIVQSDIYYQFNSRPGRGPEDDAHLSITREHILGNNLHGSPHLLKLRDQLRNLALHDDHNDPSNSELSDFMKVLVVDWEFNHPAQDFYKL